MAKPESKSIKTPSAAMATVPTNENIQPWMKSLDALATQAKSIIINTADDVAAASEIGKKIKNISKEAEASRKMFVTPFNNFVTQINALFSTVTDRCSAGETLLKDKIKVFNEQERLRIQKENEAKRAAEEKELEKQRKRAAKKGETFMPAPVGSEPIAEPAKTITSASGTQTQMREKWKFEITDPSAVPSLYLSPDEKKIKEAVAAGTREIAGVRIFQDDTVVFK